MSSPPPPPPTPTPEPVSPRAHATSTPRSSRAGLGAVGLASLLIGTTGTAAALGPDALPPEAAAAWRAVIGGLLLVVVAAAWGSAVWRYPLRSRWVLVGAVAVLVNQLAFFAALERSGVAVGTLVTIATLPVAAGLIDLAIGIRPPVTWMLGVGVAIVGVALLTGAGDGAAWSGIALAVVAGAAGAVLGLAAQRLMRDRPPVTAMATVVGAGGLLLLPVALVRADDAFASAGAAVTVVYLGVVTMAGAYALIGAGLSRLTLGGFAAVTLLEPAFAAILATTVLDEPVTAGLVGGVVLVLVGVGTASTRRPPAH